LALPDPLPNRYAGKNVGTLKHLIIPLELIHNGSVPRAFPAWQVGKGSGYARQPPHMNFPNNTSSLTQHFYINLILFLLKS